jgi:hypothetical protein
LNQFICKAKTYEKALAKFRVNNTKPFLEAISLMEPLGPLYTCVQILYPGIAVNLLKGGLEPIPKVDRHMA